MDLSADDRERIQRQFVCLFARVLRDEARNAHKEISRRARREICFSELTQTQLSGLMVMDEYPSDKTCYQVWGFDVEVRSDLLADALGQLPKRKRDLVLLYYFMDMKDAEIAHLTGCPKSTVQYQRTRAIETLKTLMNKEATPDEQYR